MGWKLNTILFRSKKMDERNLIKLLEKRRRGEEYLKIGKRSFSECLVPKEGYLYIGKYGELLVINESNMAIDFFQEPISRNEKFWRMLSKDSQDVHCFVLDSVSNLYGFASVIEQRKIRCKCGNMDESVTLDIGEPTKLEKDFYEKRNIISLIDDGEIEFHQIGEELVLYLMENILGIAATGEGGFMQLNMTAYKKEVYDDYEYITL